jgi:hypothetical protein
MRENLDYFFGFLHDLSFGDLDNDLRGFDLVLL